MMAESSSTDRVEKLLLKYKSRQAVKKMISGDFPSRQLLNEVVSWKSLIVESISLVPYRSEYGKVTVSAPPITGSASQDSLHLDVQSSVALRGLITQLLNQLRKKEKEATIQDISLSSTLTTTGPHTSLATPTKKPCPITSHRVGHMISPKRLDMDPLVERLQSQVARLEYENAKLKVELQSRPQLHEFKQCQEKVNELEKDLYQSRRVLSSEQLDTLKLQKEFEDVCSILSVTKREDIAPRLHAMTELLEGQRRLEKCLSKVLGLVYNPAAPKWVWQGDSPSKYCRPVDHHIWCEVTWDHVIVTLEEWLAQLQGLQELNLVFADMCHQLELSHPPPGPASTTGRRPYTGRRQRKSSHGIQVSFPRPMTTADTGASGLTIEDEEDGLMMRRLQGTERDTHVRGDGGESFKLREKWMQGRRREQDLAMMSTQEMAELLRHWLLDRGNLKQAWVQSVLAMIRHFQQLFDVASLDGVYAAMSRLYQHTEQSKNVLKQLKSSLQLGADCSNRELISRVEYLSLQSNGQLLTQIHNEFGVLEVPEVMEKLRLCNEFFPAFRAMVTELQEFLGVSKISEITSAVYNL